MAKALLERLLTAAFVDADTTAIEEIIPPTARIVDAHFAEDGRTGFVQTIRELSTALEERSLVHSVGVAIAGRALCHFELRGLHVGVLWGVVPAGRRLLLSASTNVEVANGRIVTLQNAWSTAHAVEGFGLKDPEAPWMDYYQTEPHAHDASGLLDGEPHRTLWARAWGLSPFLARTAVLAMAGYDAATMANALGVTTSTARTYVRDVYAATGAHGRIALLQAARRASEASSESSPT